MLKGSEWAIKVNSSEVPPGANEIGLDLRRIRECGGMKTSESESMVFTGRRTNFSPVGSLSMILV